MIQQHNPTAGPHLTGDASNVIVATQEFLGDIVMFNVSR
jgi:hypothetical protein